MRALTLLSFTACAASTPGSATRTAAQAPMEPVPGRLVVDLVDGTDVAEVARSSGLAELRWVDVETADEGLAVVEVADLAATARILTEDARVEHLEASVEMVALGFPDDPMYDLQWNMRMVGAETGWRAGAGSGVVVAVIDTGVSRVPDLEGVHILPGISLFPGEDGATDRQGHGTHVAGTIAQSTHNGLGVVGLAWGATLLPIKALDDQGRGTSESVAGAIDAAVDGGAQIINMSLGGAPSGVIARAVQDAQARGVLVVAAAGNSGREGVGSPASLPGVLAVSATGPTDQLAPYSSWGREVSISAPGGDKGQTHGGILQDTVKGTDHSFESYQGTSMASPHVAGAAAVIWGAGAGDAERTAALLLNSAEDLGEPGPDPRFGHGRLDLRAALWDLGVLHQLPLFGLGAAVAAVIAALGQSLWRGRGLVMVGSAAVSAGGLFFLRFLPLSPSLALDLASRPLLGWPARLLGQPWGELLLFPSALLPVVLTFIFGPTRALGPLVAGLSAGVGVHLLWAAFAGGLRAWPLWGVGNTAWLSFNGLLCLLCALAVTGLARSRDRQEQRA